MFQASSLIESPELIHDSVQIWHNSHIRKDVSIGEKTVIGNSVYIGPGVKVGKNCKIQNNAQIYDPAEISDYVFIGPGVVLTNDRNPRATSPDGTPKLSNNWKPVAVKIELGASIGAGSICVAPIRIGSWALVAAGSVVIKDVPNFALVAGVPAKQIAWVGKAGYKLEVAEDEFKCPQTNIRYHLTNKGLEEILIK
jgi:UDP-2-acetamido-3-amino-2,3-dideoxy-glucuronate N-acetyltransferase